MFHGANVQVAIVMYEGLGFRSGDFLQIYAGIHHVSVMQAESSRTREAALAAKEAALAAGLAALDAQSAQMRDERAAGLRVPAMGLQVSASRRAQSKL